MIWSYYRLVIHGSVNVGELTHLFVMTHNSLAGSTGEGECVNTMGVLL